LSTFAIFNKKADRNISCWQCAHFQHYLTPGGPSLNLCEGECRKNPPNRAMATLETLVGPSQWFQDCYFMLVPYGNVAWCSGFQRSTDPVPTNPGSDPSQNCLHFEFNWLDPETWRLTSWPNIPNKRPVEQSCWYCDHFQRAHEDPSTESPFNGCQGYCQQAPQPSMFELDPDYTGLGNPAHLLNAPAWAKIIFAPFQWCSKWERALDPVPPIPMTGQDMCGSPV
jgi:hypothetical protein